jgi:hypothetical protein
MEEAIQATCEASHSPEVVLPAKDKSSKHIIPYGCKEKPQGAHIPIDIAKLNKTNVNPRTSKLLSHLKMVRKYMSSPPHSMQPLTFYALPGSTTALTASPLNTVSSPSCVCSRLNLCVT